MKRHIALQDLSRDHFHGLLRSHHVRRAFDGDPKVPDWQTACTTFLDLWLRDIHLHFDEEDETLRPLLAERPDLLARLDEEHASLRAAMSGLSREETTPGRSRDAWRDAAVGLIDHIRWEEDELFPWLQEHLPEATLQALARASAAWRADRRDATCAAGRGPEWDG